MCPKNVYKEVGRVTFNEYCVVNHVKGTDELEELWKDCRNLTIEECALFADGHAPTTANLLREFNEKGGTDGSNDSVT